MPASAKVNGTWRDLASVSAKVNGSWQEIVNAYSKVNGVWQETFSSGSPPTYNLIASAVTGTTASFSFTNIDQSYDDLYVHIRNNNDSGFDESLFLMRINDVSTSQYYASSIQSNEDERAKDFGVIGGVTGTTVSLPAASTTLRLPRYSETLKPIWMSYSYKRDSRNFVGGYLNTSQSGVTKLTFFDIRGANVKSGSEFAIYGVTNA